MNKSLYEFLNLKTDANIFESDVELYNSKEEDKKRIASLFYLVLSGQNEYNMYFDPVPVAEPYDGLEFKTEEEEFYYNNGKSYIVFEDCMQYQVRFKIKTLKYYNYNNVIEVVEKAIDYTKAHPEVSKHKIY